MASDLLQRYRFRSHVLELASRTISREGQQIHLRRKVFDVLAYLVVHRDRAVGKDELIREIWAGASVSDDVLVGTVRALRKSLCEDSRSQEVIKTIHGFGYQFVASMDPWPEAPARAGRRYRLGSLAGFGVAGVVAASLIFATTGIESDDAGSVRSAIPAESVWLRFDEPGGEMAVDSSGKGNSARLLNGVTRVPGVLGGALEFDGLGGQLVGDSAGHGFPFRDSARTVACWLRTSDRTGGDRNILHWGNPSATPPRSNFHLFLSGGRMAGWGNGYGHGSVISDTDLTDGRWHHVAAVYSGPPQHSSYVYLDAADVAESSTPVPADTQPAGAAWTVGVFMGGGKPFRGALDDLRVFPAALSASMIKALYHCAFPEAAFRAPFAGRPYFLPVGGSELALGKRGASDSSVPLENGKDAFGAAQFAASDGRCACDRLRGVPIPSRVRISMDIEFPSAGKDHRGRVGPFLNSRLLSPVESPAGGNASGEWIALESNGSVTVRPLARIEEVAASSKPIDGFDPAKPHRMVVEAAAGRLRAFVDGIDVLEAALPPAGSNGAGIAFQVQGRPIYNLPQRVRNLVVANLGTPGTP